MQQVINTLKRYPYLAFLCAFSAVVAYGAIELLAMLNAYKIT